MAVTVNLNGTMRTLPEKVWVDLCMAAILDLPQWPLPKAEYTEKELERQWEDDLYYV